MGVPPREFNTFPLLQCSARTGLGGVYMRKLAPARVRYRDDFLISYRVYMMTESFHISLFEGTLHCPRHCSCRTYFCCFPLALANICPWPPLPFFRISLRNSELKTTHSTLRFCREHFIRQPFSK